MATNGDDVSENGHSKRFRVAAGPTGHGDDDGTGGDDDYDGGSDDYGALDEEPVDYGSGE